MNFTHENNKNKGTFSIKLTQNSFESKLRENKGTCF